MERGVGEGNTMGLSPAGRATRRGRADGKDEARQTVEVCPAEEASVLDIKQAVPTLGINLIGVKAGFDELVAQVREPEIIRLENPAHFLVTTRAEGDLCSFGEVVLGPGEPYHPA